jgi:hypothetical protein
MKQPLLSEFSFAVSGDGGMTKETAEAVGIGRQEGRRG